MKTFSTGSLLKSGWSITENNFSFVIRLVLIGFGLSLVSGYLNNIGRDTIPSVAAVYFFTSFAISLISVLMHIGFLKLGLRLVDGEKPKVGELFNYTNLFLRFIIVSFLYAAAMFIVLLLTVAVSIVLFFLFHAELSIGIILGGIIFFAVLATLAIAMRYMFAVVIVVDKGISPIDALKESAKLTDGIKIDLLAFSIISILLNILGAVFIGIGLLVTIPINFFAYLLLYRQVSGSNMVKSSA